MRVKWVEFKERVPHLRAEREGGREREHATVAAAAAKARQRPLAGKRERDHQPELRLVGQEAEQDAGDERPAVELDKRAAEQRGGEKAVLAVADIDQHRREGEREEEPQSSRASERVGTDRRPERPLDSEPLRAPRKTRRSPGSPADKARA